MRFFPSEFVSCDLLSVRMTQRRSGSLVDGEEKNMPLLNDLLCYVFNATKRFSLDDISVKVARFYLPECINEAKQMLWQNFSSSLPPFENRRDTLKRKAAEAEMEDILTAMKMIDSHSNGDDSPLFVSKDPFNMPSNSLTDQLPERMLTLEQEMRDLKTMIMNGMNRPNARDSWFNSGKSSWDCGNTECPPPSGQESLCGDDSCDDTTLLKGNASLNTGMGAGAQPPGAYSYAQMAGGGKTDHSDDYRIANGSKGRRWKKPKTKDGPAPTQENARQQAPKRAPCISGTKLNTTLRSGPQRTNIFVFRVNRELDESHVTQHLNSEHVKVLSIEEKSKDDAAAKSFHVLIESDDLKAVFQPSFWPKGICCKKFYIKKKEDGSK